MLQNIKLRRPEKDTVGLLQAAGFREPTPLQEQYLSTAFHGRDLVVESTEGEGKTIAQLLPILSVAKPRKRAASALILTDSVDSVEKYEREFHKFPSSATRGKTLAALGKTEQPKKELKLLSKHPAIIVGTTERIIDHIRRNNLSFPNGTTVVVNIPESKDRVEFNRDVEFILTKMPGKGNVSLFAASSDHVKELEYLLKRPVTLTFEERTKQLPPLHVYRGRETRPSTILQLIYAHNSYRALVLVHSKEEAEELRSFLHSHGISCRCIDRHTTAPHQSHEKEEAESFRCTVTTFKDARSIGLHYSSILFFGVPEIESLFIDIAQAISNYASRPTLSVVVPPGKEESFSTIQEKFQMNTKDEQFPEKEEVLKGQLKSIVQQIKEEENPDVLNRYRKLIRKSVPFFMRGYLAAYLFKNMVQGETPEAMQSEASAMQTIFVSIGKNRKVFPRDLARLFRSKVELGPNDIGNIKVLDNYSFIDIPKDRAKQAIEKMDNMDYRGRSITVNFARKKSEKRRPPQRGKNDTE